MDPYEQQLLNVFDSYDIDNKGSLDKEALTQLCQTLQLEDQTNELIRALLPGKINSSTCRASFAEFKDALLAILGNLQNSNSNKVQKNLNPEVDNNSPEREVSPKLVYGSKRYGRRSKPKLDGTPIKQQNDMNYLNKSTNVQRSNSQCETLSKKRKSPNAKVKRCTSFPGNNDFNRPIDHNKQQSNSGDEQQEHQQFICTEEMLREAWKNLGVGTDGYLNQTELILVCDAIGLHQLANVVLRQMSDKLTVDYNHKISFQELLEVLQQDETWSDLLNTPQIPSKVPQTDPIIKTTSCIISDTISVNDSSSFALKQISLGPDGSGVISADLLLDLWETAGISSPKTLLSDLGFNEHVINVVELVTVLDKEIKTINDISTTRFNNTQHNQSQHSQVALLQATVSLYQTEIRCAKQILSQVKAEREKLRTDVSEANKRAALLALEVDDNHARMEKNVAQQMKMMEQKHNDILRQVSEQFNIDKEHISTLNQNLQQKIELLENEELKLRNELKSAQSYANSVEVENQTMVLHIGELNNAKQNLSDQVVQLESEKMNGEAAQKLNVLVAQLSALHLKNSELRDRNDEMASEIQSLNREISILHNVNGRKQDLTNNLDDSLKRNNSTNDLSETLHGKHLDDSFTQLNKPIQLQLQHSTSESGFETEIEYADDSNSSISNAHDNNSHLYSKIAYLEEILRQNNIPVPDKKTDENKQSSDENECLIKKIPKQLLIQKSKSFFDKIITKVADKNVVTTLEKELTEFLKNFDVEESERNEIITFQTLKVHCNDLELCIEQLKNEYERCEDYWSAKLDEERNMFEQENCQNSEKLTELMLKLTEFEAQYNCSDTTDSRLPIIDEKGSLEKQYMDLEEEYEDFRLKIIKEIDEKNLLLEKLLTTNKTNDASIQTDAAIERSLILQEKLANLTRNEVEATNLFSYSETKSSSIDSGLTTNNSIKTKQQVQLDQTPCRPRRTRKHHERNYLYNKKVDAQMNQTQNFAGATLNQMEEPTCLMSINTLHNLKLRLHLLDQKNRHLQSVIKQQHWQHERVSQYYWQQHRGEKAEYHYSLKIVQEQLDFQLRLCNDYLDKLSKTDFLVKDLYVENAYLVAKVERLQGQCQFLSNHFSNESSSV